MSQTPFSRKALAFLMAGALLCALVMAFAPAAFAASTTVLVDNLQSSWTAPGGGGVFSAYVGPTAYDWVSPGNTALYDGREAGIIKAGINIDPTDGIYEDEGLFAIIPNVTVDALAASSLSWDVTTQEGTNPVWMTIEIDTGTVGDRGDNTIYQYVPTSNPAGWHTVDAAAGLWQKWNNNQGDVTGNPKISLAQVVSDNAGKNVVRAYLRLGMGNSYRGTGNGTIAWVDKFSVASVTYDFVLPRYWYVAKTGADTNEGTEASPFLTIQKAVNSAASGGTIHVADGTYVEQVTVDAKSLTIQGASLSTVIQAPVTMTACFATSSAKLAVVCAKNSADLTLDTVTVDGAGHGNGNYQFVGVAVRNSAGTVKNAAIKDIRDTPFSGAQHGVALYAYNDDGTSRTVTVWDNSITGFQKNAMALNASDTTPLTVDVRRNTVTGAGPTTVTAQNGIQVMGKLTTGTVADNTITGIGYDNTLATTKWVATSILDNYTSVTISNNTISAAQMGIYKYEASGSITGNNVTVNKVGVSGYGIEATDPSHAVPSPFTESESTFAATASVAASTLSVSVTGNTVTFSGPGNADTVGIEADAGYGPADLALTINGNTVTGFNYGLGVWQCTSGCTGTYFVSAAVNSNNLAGNTVGLDTNATVTVNAENNWWGSACGPSNGYISGPADASPWWLTPTGAAVTPAPITAGMSASDQCAQINSAAPNTTITYGPGVYPGGVVISADNVTINLNGAIIGPGSPAYTIYGDDDAVIGPGYLDGTLPPSGSGDPAILVQPGADNFWLQDVEVSNWLDGIQFAGTVKSLKVVNNFFHALGDAGVQVDATPVAGSVVTIEGNLFKANTGPGVKYGGTGTLPAQYNSFAAKGTCPAYTGVDASNCTFAETFVDVDPAGAADDVLNINESQSFDVKVMIDAQNLYGYAFKFSYDSTKLQKNTANLVLQAGYACIALQGLNANELGYQCSVQAAGAAAITGLTPVMVVNFTAAGAGLAANTTGPWDAYFDVDPVATTAGTMNGALVYLNNVKLAGIANARDITETTPLADDGRIHITGIAQFTGFIDVQGRADDSGALLQVYAGGLTGPVLANATSSKGGGYQTTYTGSNLLTIGTTYSFLVDKARYVKTLVTGIVPSQALSTRPLTTLTTLVLKGGDATDDDMVDVGDAGLIGGAYGATLTCPATGSCADVNGDGKVDILDLTLMGGNYGITSSNWTP